MFRVLQRRRFTVIPHFNPTTPELGNMPDIIQAGSFLNYIENSLNQLNTDIFSFWLGDARQVLLANPKYMKAVSKLSNRHPYDNKAFGQVVGTYSILVNNQPEHNRMKQYFNTIFSMQNIKNYHYSSFDTVLSNWALPTIERSLSSPDPIKGLDLGLGISLRAIIASTFSPEIILNSAKCDEYIQLIEEIWDLFSSIVQQGFIEAGSERDHRMQAANELLKQYTAESIAMLKQGQEPTLISQQLAKGKSTDEVNDQLKTLIVGGTHTTGNLLNWLLYFIAKYPDVQAQLHQEIDSLGEFDKIDNEKVHKMKYTRDLIDETIRYTYFLLTLIRINDGPDIQLPGGYVIQSGDSIQIYQKSMFYHSDYWTEPDRFNPDRFKNPKSRGLHFQPFGYQGGRICSGVSFANAELNFALARIFKKYKVELDANQKDIQIQYVGNTKPSEDILLRFSER